MAEEKSGRKVSKTIQIAASAERVWRCLVQVEAMQQWWGVDRGLVEERRGGPWALAWEASPQGFRYLMAGVIKSIQPGKRLRIEPLIYFNPERPILGPMRLTVNVREQNGKTRVAVRQDGYGEGPDWDWYYQAVVQGWKDTLARLKQYAEQPGS